ncbi:MAG TPA: glycosyl hydrolase family 65 protein [Microlunatus sp.]|nr:glycosyl hydrolase family 65 protein [Microlunatus sp.]
MSRWELTVEPWCLRECGFDVDRIGRTESLFALSNGFLGVRGNLEEGDPHQLPGTYLNGCHESYPLRYAEAGYGYPETGELMINVTDGKLIRVLVDDEPLDLRTGEVLRSERTLDFRAGTLERLLHWRSPAGKIIELTSTRVVPFAHRGVLAIDLRVRAIAGGLRLTVQSELLANQEVDETSDNPDLEQAVGQPLVAERHGRREDRAHLVHRTRRSGFRVAAAMEHRVLGATTDTSHTVEPDRACTVIRADLGADEQVRVTKIIAYACSDEHGAEALLDESDAALGAALQRGWTGLLADQRQHLDDFWASADVLVDGDDEVQQGVRFGLFHLLQASCRAEQRPIGAKGLTGTGYSGHAFWETEMFVLPVLTAVTPRAARDALTWRLSTLDLARQRAAVLRQRGAALPWRTISGRECGAYWPAGTAAFHVNAGVAAAVRRYVSWTADDDFERAGGLDLLVETARFWSSLGYHGTDGRFHLDGVTGPDEYSALVDDNTYTNLLAAQNLRDAAESAHRWPDEVARLGVTAAEITTWLAAATAMAVPWDRTLDLPQQYRDATTRQRWDFAATAGAGDYPLEDHYPYVEIYRKEVAKQADLVLALHWCGDRFDAETRARAFAYAESITVRDSSLSASTQAVLAAEAGHLELAHAYVREASLMDLDNLHRDTDDDGLHLASLAGGWIGLVCGFGGLRDHGGRLSLSPRLPASLNRLRFVLRWCGLPLQVAIERDHVTYTVLTPRAASPAREVVELLHHGQPVSVSVDRPVRRALPVVAMLTEAPAQPAGRRPGDGWATAGQRADGG